MPNIATYNQKDVIVMKLLHYFITQEGYSPIILHGAKDEIWLENQSKDYKIIRIVSNYIHNNEQYEYDLFRTKDIVKNIKKKTLNLNMNTLSIFTNLGEKVNLTSSSHIDCAKVEEEQDISKYQFIYEHFPNIDNKMDFNEKGVELFVKITDEINQKNLEEAKKAEKVFSPKKPIVTYIIIGLNILMFLVSLIPGKEELTINLFSTYGPYIRLGEYYRLLTGAFVHVDMLHIFFNMYALYAIGSQIESFYGSKKLILIYLISAITGSLLSITFSDIPSIGASGAIFGLLGSMLYFGYHYRVYLGSTIKKTIIPLIVINLVLGFLMTGIDNAAHIGGLLGGLIAGAIVGVKYKEDRSSRINAIIIGILYLGFLIYMGIFR